MYNHAPENYRCPFCLLIQGIENQYVASLQSDIIYRDDQITTFVAVGGWPNNRLNVLIAPNQHYENIYDLPVECMPPIQVMAKKIALALKAAYACDGVSLRQHNEPAGTQDVWHYHLHITPRYQDDQFYSLYQQHLRIPVEERAQAVERIKAQLG